MPLFFTTKKSSHRFFSFDPRESINKKSLQRIRSRKKLRYLPKTNIAPENGPSQKETRIPTIHFQVRTLSFREGRYSKMDGLWKMHLRLQICRAIPGIYASNFVFREGKLSPHKRSLAERWASERGTFFLMFWSLKLFFLQFQLF